MPDRIDRERDLRRRDLAALSAEGERLYSRLKKVVDDFGRYPADVELLASSCYPIQRQDYTGARVAESLEELVRHRVIHRYEADGEWFLALAGWDRDQRRRARHSKYPGPDSPSLTNTSLIQSADLPTYVVNGQHVTTNA